MENAILNPQKLNQKLYEEIKSFLITELHDFLSIQAFLSKIITKFFDSNKTTFLNFLLSNDNKTITFMRHGESGYNHWRKQSLCNIPCFYRNTPSNYDPKLTELGNIQAENAMQSLISEIVEIKAIDMVYVSPLTRALETYMKGHRNLKGLNKNLKVFACDLIRERMDYACDVGSTKKSLEQSFNDVDFLYISNEYWWIYKNNSKSKKKEKKPKIYSENNKKVYIRLLLFMLWIIVNEENNILIVSHQNVFQCLFNNYSLFAGKIKNCQFKTLEKQQRKEFLKTACNILKIS